jgi:hypothetical protein
MARDESLPRLYRAVARESRFVAGFSTTCRKWQRRDYDVRAMRRVNITIGPLSFDHADYDADNDALYLHVGVAPASGGEETPEGHVVRYAPGTSCIVGLTVLGARRVLERDGRLVVTITDAVETTADQLNRGSTRTRASRCLAPRTKP